MLVALPAAAFLLLVLLVRLGSDDGDVRTALLRAATVWGVMLVGLTELLSLLGMLTRGWMALAWAVVAALLVAAWVRGGGGLPPRPTLPVELRAVALLLPVAAIAAGTASSAAAGWPNQWDSMVYHLSRVDHWLQNRTIAFYPTHIVRQLFNPPGAEYAILHLRALGGDDRWSNAPQWLAMVGSLVGVSAIARRLGAGPPAQCFAALAAATIPMGILQASGTQNDYVVAFWLVCMADAVLAPPSGWRTFQLGAAMGLALLAKGTALLFAPPLLLALPELTRGGWRRRLVLGGAVGLLVLSLDGSHWARNTAVFGWPLGPRASGSPGAAGDRLTNELNGPRVVASNLLRNLSLHLGTPSPRLNHALERIVVGVHRTLGIAVDDPRTTRLYSDTRFSVRSEPSNPDRAGNPAHLLLGLTAVVLLAAGRPRRPAAVRYALALAVAALLFCVALKWQPWHSRLQLPLFVLAGPLMAVGWERYPRGLWVAALALVVLAVRPLLFNRLAPLAGRHTVFDTPRADQYFQTYGGRPSGRQQAYLGALGLVSDQGCMRIGLRLDWDDWEHPLWVLRPALDRGASGTRRLAHVDVANPTGRLREPGPPLDPCAILVGGGTPGDTLRHEGRRFAVARIGDGLVVYLPEDSPAGDGAGRP